MPEITDKDADAIMKTILGMKGGSSETKKGKAALAKGELWLKLKPFTYRRRKGNWNEKLGTETRWTENPQHPIDCVSKTKSCKASNARDVLELSRQRNFALTMGTISQI